MSSNSFFCGVCNGWFTLGFHDCDQRRAQRASQASQHLPTKLPTDSAARKKVPMVRGLLDYFPLALAAVAEASLIATQQHHPGEEMHWDRTKSTDHADCLVRHLMDRGTVDTDGVRHIVKAAWRALAAAQIELEEAQKSK